MNKSLLFLSAAASLAVASCNQDKPAAVDAATTPSADTAVVVNDAANTTTTDTAAYRTEADQLASRIADDLRLTDTVVVTQVTKTYYTRGRRLNEVNTRYATDTTGRYAALRQVNDETDRQVKTYVTEPQYTTYAANRATYYDGTPYSGATITTTTTRETAPARRSGPSIVKYDKKANGETKIVYSNGKTVKVDKDGDTKVEYRNGTKVKRDADDGQVKVKN